MTDFDPDEIVGYVYEQMAGHLTKRIAAGDLQSNTPLPSERRLASEHGVSLGTARHATRLLRYRGLVVTVRSKGTYVAKDAQEKADRWLAQHGAATAGQDGSPR